MMVAISPRPNQTPGVFMGITLVRFPSVQRVTVAESVERNVARLGTSGSVARSVSVTPNRSPLTVPFVNGTVSDDNLTWSYDGRLIHDRIDSVQVTRVDRGRGDHRDPRRRVTGPDGRARRA
ncbi:hypothetical protein GCM10009856_16700 [Mycolicibacterium llatzerense]